MKELISVIIPVYNSQNTISRCIDSVINSEYQNLEIICVNDGSTDQTASVLSNYESIDPRVKVITQDNSGVSSARNHGIEVCSGNYLIMIDSDDYVSPTIFSLLYSAIQEADMAICNLNTVKKEQILPQQHVHGNSIIRGNNKIFEEIIMPLIVPENPKRALLECVGNKLYKKSIIDNYQIKFPECVFRAEDWLFNLQYYKHCESISFITDYLYYYQIDDDSSLSHSFNIKDFDNAIRVQDLLFEIVPETSRYYSKESRIIDFQKTTIKRYARRNGLRHFSDYCKMLYNHERLKAIYSERNSTGNKRLLPDCCFNQSSPLKFQVYYLWCLNQVFPELTKSKLKQFYYQLKKS